jgi:hypothetical protein
MPYEISFSKRVPVADLDRYFNDCCIGGDFVVERILPALSPLYDDIRTDQEDWGWFIWMREGSVSLAVDVFTDDPEKGAFRVHLTSRAKRFLLFDRQIDTPELERLRALVISRLEGWADSAIKSTLLDQ